MKTILRRSTVGALHARFSEALPQEVLDRAVTEYQDGLALACSFGDVMETGRPVIVDDHNVAAGRIITHEGWGEGSSASQLVNTT